VGVNISAKWNRRDHRARFPWGSILVLNGIGAISSSSSSSSSVPQSVVVVVVVVVDCARFPWGSILVQNGIGAMIVLISHGREY
jgi:hypothetical protein